MTTDYKPPTNTTGSVRHEGKFVFDVTTRKWYEVRPDYRLGPRNNVHLQPPGGYDDRHLSEDDFLQEIGRRLLLKSVTQSLRDTGDWGTAVGSMAANAFTDGMGLPDDVLTCPQCGATCDDGDVHLKHTFASYDYPDEGVVLHCRDCRTDWGVIPSVIDS